jgi:polar amino acid transport system substrate-binding protein
MYFRTLALASILFCLSPIASSSDTSTEIPVLIATQTDADGKQLGVGPTVAGIVQLLADESGLKLVPRAYPWRRAQMLAESGKGLLFGAAETPERLPIFAFTRPLYVVNQWLVADAARPLKYQGWDDLRGKTVSINSGSKFATDFEERKNVLFIVTENSESVQSRLKMLALGRVDVVLLDSYRNNSRFEERLNCVYAAAGKFTVLRKPMGTEPVLIAVPKASPFLDLLPALNEAIERLDKSQGIHKILETKAAGAAC